jgi:hypothetical protein
MNQDQVIEKGGGKIPPASRVHASGYY